HSRRRRSNAGTFQTHPGYLSAAVWNLTGLHVGFAELNGFSRNLNSSRGCSGTNCYSYAAAGRIDGRNYNVEAIAISIIIAISSFDRNRQGITGPFSSFL